MKTAVVIYNPNSGHVLKKKNLGEYKKIIEKHGYRVTFIGTQYHGHAKEIVSHLGYVDLVMSMGGDGTFNEVVYGNTLRKNPLVLAHIPIGTTNDIGKMFGYSNDIEKNIELCLKGEVKNIDIPTINKRPFIYVAGFGKFLNIAYDTTRVAGFDSFFKDVKLDDDQFEVYIVTTGKRLGIVRTLGLSAIKGPKNIKDVISFRTNNIKIKFKARLKKNWCIDGEKLEIRSLTYDIKNIHSISMLVPKKNLNKLFIK